MRMGYLMVCVILGGLAGAKLATADRQPDTSAPHETAATKPSVASGGGGLLCPLWPIEDLGGGYYLFYAERYENFECQDPLAALYQGDAPGWPYYCPDCEGASLVAPEEQHGSKPTSFEGLKERVPAEFRPVFPDQLRANDGVSFSGEEFVEFQAPGSESIRRVKLFRVTLDRAAAGNRKGVSRTIGLGYEAVREPGTTPTMDAMRPTASPVTGTAHACKLRIGTQDYIVLLAK